MTVRPAVEEIFDRLKALPLWRFAAALIVLVVSVLFSVTHLRTGREGWAVVFGALTAVWLTLISTSLVLKAMARRR